jgi:uncharacterized protein YbjT (DUF2867 family)
MILVVGSTGTIGSSVVRALANYDVEVTALGSKRRGKELPANATFVEGDVRDIDFMRQLVARSRTVFLLHPVVNDESTRSVLTLSLIRDAGVERVVYLSMQSSDTWTDVPHAAAKFAAERMIEDRKVPATILRPHYFFQNDTGLRELLVEQDLYPMPIGAIGISMVDARDVGEVAAIELAKREKSAQPLPTETIQIAGPHTLTGESISKLWSDVLGRTVRYVGDDLASFEKQVRAQMPPDMAYDLVLMFRRFQEQGYLDRGNAAKELAKRLGRPLRTYRAFAEERKAEWLRGVRRAMDQPEARA